MSNNVSQMHSRDEIDSELELVDYAAGRLGDEQRTAFEQRLKADPEWAERLEEERALREALQTADSTDIPPAAAFEGIAGKLHDERRRSLRWPAIAAGLVAVIAVAFLMQGPLDSTDGRDGFETLSNDGAQPVASDHRARIVFAADTDAAGRAAAAAELGFAIVSGPGPGGAFVVETEKPASRDQLLEWRQDSRIELAEPVRYD